MLLLLAALSLTAAPDRAKLAQMVDTVVNEHDLPSGAAALVLDHQLVLTRTWGPRKDDPADMVDPDAVFRIASITKAFTALAVLQLRDAGKLSLDDPLSKWLPEAKLEPANFGDRPPTIRDALLHQSGLPRMGKLRVAQDDHDVTEAELLAALNVKLVAAPGTRYLYSNLAFSALGLVIQRASGQRYRDYLLDHLLHPLGMKSACWEESAIPAAHRVWGHERSFWHLNHWRAGGKTWRLGAAEASGGLDLSAPDLAKLAIFEMASDAQTGPVRRASVLESQTPVPPGPRRSPGAGYGLGIRDVPGIGRVIQKNGGLENWSSMMMMVPARGAAVVLLVAGNSDQTDASAHDILVRMLREAGADTAAK